MEILDQLQTKVRNDVQKIEELQTRVNELEAIKKQYEEKMSSLVNEIGDLDATTSSESSDSSSDSEQVDGQQQESLYRHQF